jgi:integrase
MASIQHAYRRGAVYWWRRRISLGGGGYLALYLSLRTRRPAEARRRAHALTVVSDEMKTHILDVTEAILSREARKRIFQTALGRQLDRIITDQVDTPHEAEAHRRLNAFFAALYRIWAARGTAAVPEAADLGRLRADGWTEEDVQAFDLFARSTPAVSVISTAKTKDLLAEVGVAATGLNVRQAHQIICEARARACVEASAQLGQPVPYADGWAREVLGDAPASTAPAASAPPEAAVAPAGRSPSEPAPSTSPEPPCPTVSAVLEEWRSTWAVRHQDLATLKQYAQSVALLARLVGDLSVDKIDEDILALFVKKTERLAINYRMGSPRDILVPENHSGPSGLSPVTLQRHLTGIGVFLDWARRRYKTIARLDFSGLAPRTGSVRARDKRDSWTDDECALMLETPPFKGCKGAKAIRGRGAVHERLQPGPHIFHDAWYWVLLLLYYCGVRRGEACKLLASDVGEAEGIPFIAIRPTVTGRLKNTQSKRKIPIHPELMRLGFLEFVRARTQIPHLAIDNQGVSDWELFPELRPGGGEADYGSVYYKRVWSRFLPVAMGDRAGERDIHSFRHGFSDFLDTTGCKTKEANDLFGHETGTTRGKIYGEMTPLPRLAEIISLRRPITAALPVAPLHVPALTTPPPPFVARHRPLSMESRKALKRNSARDR